MGTPFSDGTRFGVSLVIFVGAIFFAALVVFQLDKMIWSFGEKYMPVYPILISKSWWIGSCRNKLRCKSSSFIPRCASIIESSRTFIIVLGCSPAHWIIGVICWNRRKLVRTQSASSPAIQSFTCFKQIAVVVRGDELQVAPIHLVLFWFFNKRKLAVHTTSEYVTASEGLF